MKSRLAVVLVILTVVLTGCSTQQKSKAFPEKPIEVVVPYAAGGSTDIVGRVLEKVMRKYLPNGQTIVIVNKPGGASVVGTTEVAKAKPDGYRVALVPAGSISVQPSFGNAPYKPDDFQGVIKLATSPIMFAVKTDAPWKTFQEWVEYVEKNPGAFVYGSAGSGNPAQLGLEKFINAKGLKVKYVPYDGTSQVYTALLGGHIHGEATTSQELKGQVDSQAVRILANLGTVKDDFYKDVPTLKEMGYDMSTEIYFGVVAPKGVSKENIAILHDAFKKAMDDPEVKDIFRKSGIKADYAAAEEFTNQIKNDYQDYNKTLKDIGMIK